jgi:NitT/TauT family transport system permease protein
MPRQVLSFKVEQRPGRAFTWGDALALGVVAALVYAGVRLALGAPEVIRGPQISLSPRALPLYAALSTTRMTAAYALSMLFTLIYGRTAAYNRRAEQLLMPLLDVLQSVPILSFLPVVLLGLSAFLPQNLAAELASIVLIFTSMAWNLTFAWFQSLTTLPKELKEASAIFRLNGWLRFKSLEFPFAAISLVWNSMMSWAGGWFFLMAAESFTVGARNFQLPGLGSYLYKAANEGDFQAIAWGVATLVLTIIALDQLVWRPLLAWSERFKVEMIESDQPPTSWFYDVLRNAWLVNWLGEGVFKPIAEFVDAWLLRHYPARQAAPAGSGRRSWLATLLSVLLGAGLIYGIYRAAGMLATIPPTEWAQIGMGVLATFLRVVVALLIALAWTVPVGVAIGTNRRLATVLQPVVQIIASVPATALFPIILLFVLQLPAGLNLAAILLMLLGTQWYLLFNIIAGASAIPQDLKYTTTLMQLGRGERWRTLILPALFPFLVTGAITASGGAWNASIVAEYQYYGGHALQTTGVGALITSATARGDYALLLAATLSMIVTVILINRLFWRRLYRLAEEKYRME